MFLHCPTVTAAFQYFELVIQSLYKNRCYGAEEVVGDLSRQFATVVRNPLKHCRPLAPLARTSLNRLDGAGFGEGLLKIPVSTCRRQ